MKALGGGRSSHQQLRARPCGSRLYLPYLLPMTLPRPMKIGPTISIAWSIYIGISPPYWPYQRGPGDSKIHSEHTLFRLGMLSARGGRSRLVNHQLHTRFPLPSL